MNSRPPATFKLAEYVLFLCCEVFYLFLSFSFDIIVFLGRDSNLCDSASEYASELNPARSEVLEFLDAGHLLTVLSPQLLINPLKLFLQGQGLPWK